MKLYHLLAGLLLIGLIMSGCSASSGGGWKLHSTGNPSAADVLKQNPEADIFQFDGLIYTTGIDWVEELDLTKGEQVGEISTHNDSSTKFQDGMANKLPAGSKIFTTKEKEGPILLVEVDGKLLRYYGLVEG